MGIFRAVRGLSFMGDGPRIALPPRVDPATRDLPNKMCYRFGQVTHLSLKLVFGPVVNAEYRLMIQVGIPQNGFRRSGSRDAMTGCASVRYCGKAVAQTCSLSRAKYNL